jgi:molecular chaperone DnaK (HSP70)
MLMAAIDNAEEDVTRRLTRDAKVESERIVHEARKRLDDHGFLLEANEREKIDAAVKALEQAIGGSDDFRVILAKKDELVAASNKFAERVMNWEIERAVKGHAADELAADGQKESMGLKHLREQAEKEEAK